MRTILITSGAGFIGSNFTRYSLARSEIQAPGWRSRHTFEEALEKTVR